MATRYILLIARSIKATMRKSIPFGVIPVKTPIQQLIILVPKHEDFGFLARALRNDDIGLT
jgi:hypothetical protein